MCTMAGRFDLIEHGGDLRLRGMGESVEEVAGELLKALWAAMFEPAPAPEPERWVAWGMPAELMPAMALVELLADALFGAAVDGEAFVAFRGDLFDGDVGVAVLPDGLTAVREVKAVTYNDPLLMRLPDGSWLAEVTVDL